MADLRVRRVEKGHTKIRNVPIAVTPEGFWCCPSPVVVQRTLKVQENIMNEQKSALRSQKTSIPKNQSHSVGKKPNPIPTRTWDVSDDQTSLNSENPGLAYPIIKQRSSKANGENIPRKVSVQFGESDTSDFKVVLLGKKGFTVKMNVHKNVIMKQSSFFDEKLSNQASISFLEIEECEDVEIYVETVGLMYCAEMKKRLMKQSVLRVLRILKVADVLGFNACIWLCLDYLEAVPWVGEEEEEKVVSSLLNLRIDDKGKGLVLKRVTSEFCSSPNVTLNQIFDLVLKSDDDRGRRDMKALVLKLLKENNIFRDGGVDIDHSNIYNLCRNCLDSLFSLFKQAVEPGLTDTSVDNKGSVVKRIALQIDNLLWLLEILFSRQIADDFVLIWVQQHKLAELSPKLPAGSRHLVSCITARIFVGIGRSEVLLCKDTRMELLQTWLQPLIDDYNWLLHGCRSFDKKMVEEGIGRTILTLPLEEQQRILLSWMSSFLKNGNHCPDLRCAFEVWWRRTFTRSYMDQHAKLVNTTENVEPYRERTNIVPIKAQSTNIEC